MIKIIKWLLHHWNPIISIIAFVFSVITFVSGIINNRKKIKIEINNYTMINESKYNLFIFNLDVMNCSRLPISINEIKFMSDTVEYIVRKHPSLVTTRKIVRGQEIQRYQENHSARFPINLSGLSSEQYFVELSTPKGVNKLDDTIIITTNRGTLKIKLETKNKKIIPKEFIAIAKEYYDYLRI